MHNSAAIRINKLFADSVFTLYRKRRYGLKKCQMTYAPEFLGDLRELHARSVELKACERTFSKACSLTTLEEKIKTL
ncbi:MAG: hypothetical protein EBR30_03555 [Cytophagia bacterium]|jgi:hypothetical protein|nr:hypothetical protein [Cytophagia bacterium]NBW34089.1 hypothetical protein [Cytophagia bacterium]